MPRWSVLLSLLALSAVRQHPTAATYVTAAEIQTTLGQAPRASVSDEPVRVPTDYIAFIRGAPAATRMRNT
jgi:hypothetical protein